MRLVAGFMDSLLGGSRSGGSFSSSDARCAQGRLTVGLVAVFVVETLAFSSCPSSRNDCFNARGIASWKIDLLTWEIYAWFIYPFYWYIFLFTVGLEVEASAANASADVLSPLGIFVSSNLSNCWAISCKSERYASFLSFFASYSPWN